MTADTDRSLEELIVEAVANAAEKLDARLADRDRDRDEDPDDDGSG